MQQAIPETCGVMLGTTPFRCGDISGRQILRCSVCGAMAQWRGLAERISNVRGGPVTY